MIKLIAIGDIHGMWDEAWSALRAAHCATAEGQPTTAVQEGVYQVIFTGDLVHYKDFESYDRLVGGRRFDPYKADHLHIAAKTQIEQLYHLQTYVTKSNGNANIIMGNHDEDALTHHYGLMTAGGLQHNEFNALYGGLPLPEELHNWFLSFPRECVYYGVQVAHAGPLPSMQYFDDFFYNDRDSKHWWNSKPELVTLAKHRFGVYGHTVMDDGIYVSKENRFAMIDALAKRQYFEMILSETQLNYRVVSF